MLNESDIKKVKAQGFLRNRGTENFSGRVITENGVLTAAEVRTICEAAQLYGNGNVSFTSRLTVEVPGIPFEKIPEFQAYIAKAGLVTGGTGPKVRPVVACKGTTCVFGLYDTQALAKEIHDRFYVGYHDVTLPHKFKIACGGCPNNCVKPDLNDLGIIGQRPPKFDEAACRSCKKCIVAEKCPMKAITRENGGMPVIHPDICNNCGRCADKCPFHAFGEGEVRYRVYVGGRWGKKVHIGEPLSRLFTKDELLDIVEKSILLFKREGAAGERFSDTLGRIGMTRVEELLFSDELPAQKGEILSK